MLARHELYSNTVDNIEKIRIEQNMSQEKMAEYLDMSLSGYKRMINNTNTKIDAYIIYQVACLSKRFAFEIIGGCDDIAFLSGLRKLPFSQKLFIHSMVDVEKQLSNGDKGSTTIPLITFTGDMKDGMLYDSMNIETISVNNTIATCAVRVTSNHLHPAYHKGDILLVRQEPPRNGDIGIFINKEDGCIYVRKFMQTDPCRLEPINNYGTTFLVSQDDTEEMDKWIKFGYVLKKMR